MIVVQDVLNDPILMFLIIIKLLLFRMFLVTNSWLLFKMLFFITSWPVVRCYSRCSFLHPAWCCSGCSGWSRSRWRDACRGTWGCRSPPPPCSWPPPAQHPISIQGHPSFSHNLVARRAFLRMRGLFNLHVYVNQYIVKKVSGIPRPQSGWHLPSSPWVGIKLFLPRESLVSDIPLGDENVAYLFLRCSFLGVPCFWNSDHKLLSSWAMLFNKPIMQ